MFEPHDGAGHAGGAGAVEAAIGDGFAVGVEEHRGGRGARGGFAKVDEPVPAAFLRCVGEVQGHEPATADIAAARVHDRQRVTDRDRRIDCVAAPAQDVRAHFGGEALGGHDHTALPLDGRGGGGLGARGG